MRKALVIRRRGGIYVLPVDSIVYMENKGRKILVHTLGGEYEFYGKLSDVVEDLDQRIVMCHRSYAINIENVDCMENGRICFIDGSEVYLGRETFNKAKTAVTDYLSGNRKISLAK